MIVLTELVKDKAGNLYKPENTKLVKGDGIAAQIKGNIVYGYTNLTQDILRKWLGDFGMDYDKIK